MVIKPSFVFGGFGGGDNHAIGRREDGHEITAAGGRVHEHHLLLIEAGQPRRILGGRGVGAGQVDLRLCPFAAAVAHQQHEQHVARLYAGGQREKGPRDVVARGRYPHLLDGPRGAGG